MDIGTLLSILFDYGLSSSSVVQSLTDGIRTIAVVLLIFTALQCFLGLKLFKLWCAIFGFLVFAAIGAVIGIAMDIEAAAVLVALGLGVLGAFLGFKLYKLGVFLLTTSLSLLLFFLFTKSLPVSLLLGIAVGIASIFLTNYVIIITTSVSGGMLSGTLLGIALAVDSSAVSVLLGILFTVGGIVVQYNTNKKAPRPAAAGSGSAAAIGTATYAPMATPSALAGEQAAVSVPISPSPVEQTAVPACEQISADSAFPAERADSTAGAVPPSGQAVAAAGLTSEPVGAQTFVAAASVPAQAVSASFSTQPRERTVDASRVSMQPGAQASFSAQAGERIFGAAVGAAQVFGQAKDSAVRAKDAVAGRVKDRIDSENESMRQRAKGLTFDEVCENTEEILHHNPITRALMPFVEYILYALTAIAVLLAVVPATRGSNLIWLCCFFAILCVAKRRRLPVAIAMSVITALHVGTTIAAQQVFLSYSAYTFPAALSLLIRLLEIALLLFFAVMAIRSFLGSEEGAALKAKLAAPAAARRSNTGPAIMVRCPQCSALNAENDRFCGGCGAPLQASAAAASAPAESGGQ